ncbi:hypothetical protein HanRHA438_Chr02g0086261 [Helianthus annuus]|nr:hypothetical protein HanRHA438_Chr02g0086261 [Helianthus annuus]
MMIINYVVLFAICTLFSFECMNLRPFSRRLLDFLSVGGGFCRSGGRWVLVDGVGVFIYF